MGLRIASRYPCAFKMPSIKCTCVRCPWHSPTHTTNPLPPYVTQSTTFTSANRSPTQWNKRYHPSALNCENWDSSMKITSLQRARRHQLWTFASSSWLEQWTAGRDPDEDDKHADDPEVVSDSLCRRSLFVQTNCFSSCPGSWSQTILAVNMLDVELLGWCGYTCSVIVRLVRCTAKLSETPL